jgi:hypothetical protein
MTITLPDMPGLSSLGEPAILLDHACGAYAAGQLSSQAAADVAGVSRLDFDEVLDARRISDFTEEALAQDLETLRVLGFR